MKQWTKKSFLYIHLTANKRVCILFCGNAMQSKTLFYCQAAEALSQAARNDSQAARVDREAMSVGGKDSESEAFDFSIAVVSLHKTKPLIDPTRGG